MRSRTELNGITGQILDSSIRIHSRVGPGLLESVYERILARDLSRLGYHVEQQKPISFEFEGLHFENAYRADLIVQNSVIVEVKSAVSIPAASEKQLLTYLRVLDYRVGLLINFGAPYLKDGYKRIVNRF